MSKTIFIPRDGDFVTIILPGGTYHIGIFKEIADNCNKDLMFYCTYYIDHEISELNTSYQDALQSTKFIFINSSIPIEDFRLATLEEKSFLLRALAKEGFIWNKEIKKLVKLVLPEGEIVYIKTTNGAEFISLLANNSAFKESGRVLSHCSLAIHTNNFYYKSPNFLCRIHEIEKIRLATPEEKNILLKVMKENGYDLQKHTRYIPKNGDFVYIKTKNANEYICIFEKYVGNRSIKVYIYTGIEFKNIRKSYRAFCSKSDIAEIREATSLEKVSLLDRIEKRGYSWDSTTNELKKIRRRAKRGEKYFFVDNRCRVLLCDDYYWDLNNEHFKVGNYFMPDEYEKAKECADEIKEVFAARFE